MLLILTDADGVKCDKSLRLVHELVLEFVFFT